MLELSRALSLLIKKNNNPSKNNIKEVLRWFELGLHCARLDAACINNEEIKKAVASIEKCYKANVASLYKMKKIKNSSQWRTKNGATKLAICTTWDPTISNLSPQWIGNHGIKAAYLGELPDMKDKSDWPQARSEEHEAILRELSQPES